MKHRTLSGDPVAFGTEGGAVASIQSVEGVWYHLKNSYRDRWKTLFGQQDSECGNNYN